MVSGKEEFLGQKHNIQNTLGFNSNIPTLQRVLNHHELVGFVPGLIGSWFDWSLVKLVLSWICPGLDWSLVGLVPG